MVLQVPEAWLERTRRLTEGVHVVLGGADSGKSTFVRFLFSRLPEPRAYLDLDPGQSVLALPTLLAARLGRRRAWFFVGTLTPRHNGLLCVAGAARLRRWAERQGARWIIVDTTGFVDPAQGGLAFKRAELEALEPTRVWAFEDALPDEIRALRDRFPWTALPRPPAARRRDAEERRRYRALRFRRYFRRAKSLSLPPDLPGVRSLRSRYQLCALLGKAGFARGLAVVLALQPPLVLSPVRLRGIREIAPADLLVFPETGAHYPLPPTRA